MDAEPATKGHVLVVEDDKDFAALIESVLIRQGYRVTVAYDCEEALEKIREGAPDLITLDLQMPPARRKSGLHFYRQVKSRGAHRNLPIVVVTGVMRGDPDMRNLVRAFLEVDHVQPPAAYIDKPFDNKALIDAVGKAMAEKKQAGRLLLSLSPSRTQSRAGSSDQAGRPATREKG